MTGIRVAIRYAKAILRLAEDEKAADTVYDDMKLIAKAVQENKELQLLLKSPVVPVAVKKATLKDIFSSTHKITRSLIDLLANNNRIALLPLTAQEYMARFDMFNEKEVAVVTTAVPLTDELRERVLLKAKELTGNKITIQNTIDKDIMGGFILRIGDLQYNGSIANMFSNLKKEILN